MVGTQGKIMMLHGDDLPGMACDGAGTYYGMHP